MSHNNTSSVVVDGERTSGNDVRQQNVTACTAIANIVKTSLGPEGLDKMLVDQIGDVTITNDGATILGMLDVEHPAAQILVNIAQLQDEEVGDGTTSVVIVAAELLRRAHELVKTNIHATSVIAGYRLAVKEAVRYIRERQAIEVDTLGKETLINVAKTSMSSKIIGSLSDFFADMAVNATLRVKTTNKRGKSRYPIKAINVLKSHGKSAKESMFIEGYALNCTIASQQMPKSLKGVKVACVDFNLNKVKLAQGTKVVVKDPKQLEAIRKREADMAKERIQMILNTGANLILTTKGIDDMNLKYMVEAGVIGVRRVTKADLAQIAKATGATVVATLADFEGGEAFPADALGACESISQEPIGDNELILIRGCANSRTSSIILRGANEHMLDEMQRSMHDALCVVMRTLESGRVVPGGGCTEAALSVYLRRFATTIETAEQLAVRAFAEALLVIPKTLANNAAQDAIELTTRLIAAHAVAQKKGSSSSSQAASSSSSASSPASVPLGNSSRFGLKLHTGEICDNVIAGVLEPAMSKVKSFKFATEAAISILRIDEFIKLNPPPPPPQHGH